MVKLSQVVFLALHRSLSACEKRDFVFLIEEMHVGMNFSREHKRFAALWRCFHSQLSW